MNLLVIGATGGTGTEVIKQALAAGHRVTALVRDPNKLPLQHPALRVVQGDVLDATAVARALEGCEAVVSALGVKLGQPPGSTRSRGTRTLVELMQLGAVRRLVAVSTVGAGDSRRAQSMISRWLLPRLIGAARLAEADAQEAIIAASALAWTIVRPPRLVDGPMTGSAQAAVGLRTSMRSQIRRADLAHFLLDEAVKNQFVRAAPTVSA